MTYLSLLLVGLLPPIALLGRHAATRNSAPEVPGRHQAAALGLLVLLAAAATLPWDAALIGRGTWVYPRGRPVGWIAGVPIEELLFIILQPVLIGLWVRNLATTSTGRPPGQRARLGGAGLLLGTAALGILVASTPRGTYLGWLLAWAGPLLALQCAVAGDVLWRRRRQLTIAVVPPVLYLCALDRLALHLQLWELSPARTTGLAVLGLPVEEIVFFLLTTVLSVAGLILATDTATLRRVRHALPTT